MTAEWAQMLSVASDMCEEAGEDGVASMCRLLASGTLLPRTYVLAKDRETAKRAMHMLGLCRWQWLSYSVDHLMGFRGPIYVLTHEMHNAGGAFSRQFNWCVEQGFICPIHINTDRLFSCDTAG